VVALSIAPQLSQHRSGFSFAVLPINTERACGTPMASPGDWSDAARTIGSEYVGEYRFDQVASPNECDDLMALADLTSPAIRAVQGEIELVPLGNRLYGPRTGLIMSAFSWPGHGSRFSDGKFGVFHAGAGVWRCGASAAGVRHRV